MPTITTFLTYRDDAEKAVDLYVSIFPRSRVLSTTRYPEGGPGPDGGVMTIDFELNGRRYVALNGGSSFTFSQGISLAVECETQKEIDELWERLSEGGEQGPCGWLTDRFGVSWQVYWTGLPELLADEDRERAERAFQAMLGMRKIEIAEIEQAAGAPA
jgi:predicted 3-demethylubiquinone-9 3-methyltransferase (glyoxalase superfamily)